MNQQFQPDILRGFVLKDALLEKLIFSLPVISSLLLHYKEKKSLFYNRTSFRNNNFLLFFSPFFPEKKNLYIEMECRNTNVNQNAKFKIIKNQEKTSWVLPAKVFD